MSYKKFNDLQNLYEGVVSESNEIDEYTELVYNVIIAEMVYRGHSESVIRTYLENINEEQILEKVESFFSLEEYNLNEEQTDLLFSFYQEQQQLINEGWKQKAGQYGWQILKRLKGSSSKLKNQITSALKGFGKGKGTKQLELNLKGAKDGPGLLQKLKNLKTSTGNKLKNFRSKFDRKVTKTSDKLLGPDGKPLKTTKTVNPINKKNAAILGTGIVGGAVLSSGGDKKKDNSSNNVTDNDTDKDKKDDGLSWKDMKDGGLLDKPLIPKTPKKKNAAGVEMTGSGTKDDPWISKAVKVKDVHIPMTDPRNPHYYKGIEKGLPNKADWLKKTSNSPAAKSGAFSDDQRWAQQLKHREWQDKNNRGAFKVKDNPDTPGNEAKQASKDAAFARRNKSLIDKGLKPITKKESYDAKGEVLGEGALGAAKDAAKKVGKVAGGRLGYVTKKVTDSITKSKQSKATPGAKAPQSAPQSAPDAPAKAPNARAPKSTGPKGGESQRTEQSLPKPKGKDAPTKAAPQSAQESYDAYDLVLNYIMETEQASTIEEANYIMLEMDQNTIHEIVEEQKKTLGEGLAKLVGLGAAGYGLWKAGKWAKKKGDDALDGARKNMKIGGENRKKEIEKKSGVDLSNW